MKKMVVDVPTSCAECPYTFRHSAGIFCKRLKIDIPFYFDEPRPSGCVALDVDVDALAKEAFALASDARYMADRYMAGVVRQDSLYDAAKRILAATNEVKNG